MLVLARLLGACAPSDPELDDTAPDPGLDTVDDTGSVRGDDAAGVSRGDPGDGDHDAPGPLSPEDVASFEISGPCAF